MIVPIIAGFALGSLITHSASRRPHRDTVRTGYHSPDVGHPRDGASTFYLTLFTRVVEMGKTPSEALANAAIEEASNLGDWETAEALTQYAFEKYPSSETTVLPPDATEESKGEGEPEKTVETLESLEMKSPFEGIKDDDWRDFVAALQTESPEFKSENHVGAFHHHRKRLGQLGIDDANVESLKGQYEAIVADIVDNREKGGSLIKKFTAEPLTIDGKEHTITASGVLGVLKAAGPKGALQWFSSDKDRGKYAKTTESFLRCNGCF